VDDDERCIHGRVISRAFLRMVVSERRNGGAPVQTSQIAKCASLTTIEPLVIARNVLLVEEQEM